jgi:hypothetical protein
MNYFSRELVAHHFVARFCLTLFPKATRGYNGCGWAVTEPSGCGPLDQSRHTVPPAWPPSLPETAAGTLPLRR